MAGAVPGEENRPALCQVRCRVLPPHQILYQFPHSRRACSAMLHNMQLSLSRRATIIWSASRMIFAALTSRATVAQPLHEQPGMAKHSPTSVAHETNCSAGVGANASARRRTSSGAIGSAWSLIASPGLFQCGVPCVGPAPLPASRAIAWLSILPDKSACASFRTVCTKFVANLPHVRSFYSRRT